MRIKPDVRVARNTIWPKQDVFHIPATRQNLDELLELTLNHAEPEICDHLVLYRDRQVLLWLHDASDGTCTDTLRSERPNLNEFGKDSNRSVDDPNDGKVTLRFPYVNLAEVLPHA